MVELRADYRMFRVDRIAQIEVGVPFRPEKDKNLRNFYASDCHHH